MVYIYFLLNISRLDLVDFLKLINLVRLHNMYYVKIYIAIRGLHALMEMYYT